MSDVVLTLPVKAGEEALMFGRFLNGFLETVSPDAEQWASANGEPYLMVRSDPPFDGEELKVLTFQESTVATAFAAGWAKIRGAATALTRR
jgi:hypothetical protein